MARYVTRTTVYNSQIMGLFLPGGQINDEAKDLSREVEARAIAKAIRFSRSGEIAGSHRRAVVPSGIYGTRAYVENDAPHALYKHRGTTVGTVIRSKRPVDRRGAVPGKLWLRPGPGYPAYSFRSWVSGYHPGSAEPWLLDATNEVIARYGVRTYDPGTGGDVGVL